MHITPLDAYKATLLLLTYYHQQTQSNDIASLVSCMQFEHDSQPLDMAYMRDWQKSVQGITQEPFLNEHSAFKAMQKFLEIYCSYIPNDDVQTVLGKLQLIDSDHSIDSDIWYRWLCYIDAVKKNLPGADGKSRWRSDWMMNLKEAYRAMVMLLSNHYKTTEANKLDSFINNMMFINVEESVDPCAWRTWLNVVDTYKNQTTINESEAFLVMVKFLGIYNQMQGNPYIKAQLPHLQFIQYNKSTDSETWNAWFKAINSVLDNFQGTDCYAITQKKLDLEWLQKNNG